MDGVATFRSQNSVRYQPPYCSNALLGHSLTGKGRHIADSLMCGLIVDRSCDFGCGFCDLKELAARQVNDTV